MLLYNAMPTATRHITYWPPVEWNVKILKEQAEYGAWNGSQTWRLALDLNGVAGGAKRKSVFIVTRCWMFTERVFKLLLDFSGDPWGLYLRSLLQSRTTISVFFQNIFCGINSIFWFILSGVWSFKYSFCFSPRFVRKISNDSDSLEIELKDVFIPALPGISCIWLSSE